MSDVQARPSATRGRGSGRGGRGGFASRGGRSGGRANGPESKSDGVDNPSAFEEDQGVITELKKQYGDKTPVIKEMFPDWSEVDILFALQETDGDETEAVTRIAEGSISQWGEVSKTKKVPRSKKDPSTSTPDQSASVARPARGGRNVSEGGRGRGRATERGGRSGRGRSSVVATTNGARQTSKENQPLSVPTEESSAWDTKPEGDAWTEAKPSPPAAAPADEGAQPAASGSKTWASMLRQSTAPKVVVKPKEAPVSTAESIEPLPAAAPVETEQIPEPVPEPVVEEAAQPSAEKEQEPATSEVPRVIEPEIALPPSKDQLTETNLEQVHDDSHPPATATVASTAADSWDPRTAGSATATPLSASQHQHQQAARPTAQPTSSGYAASALKATAERANRTPSYQRRVLDQEEAVRMPGNREVDRAAVQFGAFNLGSEEDIDGDREEPETRAQPPAESPIAHPRTSLPPAVPQPAVPEAFASQKPAQSAAPTNAAPTAATPTQPSAASQAQPGAQAAQGQYSRFGQTGAQEPSSFPQKPVDPFSQQANSSQGQLDAFQSQQTQAQAQAQGQQPGGAFSSAPSDYSSYYAAEQNRAPYNNYYNQPYGQQGGQGQQDGLASQQRSYGSYNSSQADNLSQYPQSASLHNQSRYGAGGVSNDAHNSGHTTPNPTTQAQQQGAATQASQPQSHAQQGYNYNHPYSNSPYYQGYMNYNHYNQGGYGAPYGKGGMFQPYGMSPQGPYDHSSSPASGFGQSSLHRADSGLSSGLGSDYGRAGSAQAGNPSGLGAGSGFGGIQDSYGRSGSSFPSAGGPAGGFAGGQPAPSAGAGAGNDDLKPFGDSKTGSGPSPSLGGARPGSATQSTPGQAGLPPPQSGSQMGYGGYPSHLQGHNLHGGSQYGMSGSGQHGSAGFGSYGQGYGNYYGSGNQQQQQQQQQRGWGGNYH